MTKPASSEFSGLKIVAKAFALLLVSAIAVFPQTPAAPAQASATTVTAQQGKVLGISSVGRMISDLDKSVAFYKLIGFTEVPGDNTSWHKDDAMNRFFGIKGAQIRTAQMTINSSLSGKPFTLYLHELKGIQRTKLAGYNAWEPGATHFSLSVPDAELLWSQLKAANMLWPRSWRGELIVPPGQTKGSIAYTTDPDGLDIEIVNQRPATPAADGRPARPGSPPGITHVGIIILDSDKAKGFYGDLLGGELPITPQQWLQGDFYDSAIGGHGNILRFFNESFPEANATDVRTHVELVEFQNRKKPVVPYTISDVSVAYIAFAVEDLDALFARVKAGGASVVSTGGIVKMKDGTRAVLVRDPDVGAFVELYEKPKN